MKQPMRIVGAVAAAMALTVSACGSDSPAKGSGSTVKSNCPVDKFKSATTPTEVIVWHSYVGKTKQTLEKIAADYNASQTKVKVTVESQGNSYEELLRKFKQALPSKKLPAIELGEDSDTQTMVDTKAVLPAQDCIDADADPRGKMADTLPAITEHYSINGKIQPAAFNVSTIVLYYNRDHFRKAGLDPDMPPTTLDEVYADAAKLKAAKVTAQPFVLKTDPWFVEQWVTGAGAPIVDHDNGRSGLAEKSSFDNPATHRVYDWLAKMKKADLINAVPGTEGQINHYLAMATQKASMAIETSTAITTINGVIQGTFDPADLGQENNPAVAAFKGIKISLDVGVGLDPGLDAPGKGQVGGGVWYITNTGTPEVQSAAWDFAKYFNETAQQVQWTLDGSYLPIMKSVNADPAITKEFTSSQRGKWLAISTDGLAHLDAKFNGPIIGPYTATRQAIRKSIEGVLQTGQSPSDAIKQADTDINTALKDYKDSNF